MFQAATHPGVRGFIAAISDGTSTYDLYPLGQRENSFYSRDAAETLSFNSAARANRAGAVEPEDLEALGMSLRPRG
jgi:hypothetical protein